jgi:hypothetical protein
MAEHFRRIHIGSHWLDKQFTDEYRTTPDGSGGSPEVATTPSTASPDQPPAVDVDTFAALVAAAGG